MQKNTFVAEDIQPLDDVFVGPAAAVDEQDEAEAEAEENEGEDEPAEEEEELTWNDVWEGIKEDTTEIPETTVGQGPFFSFLFESKLI
jgi:nuclear GTP-binding protein